MRLPLVGMEKPEFPAVLGPGAPSFRAGQLYRALYRNRVASLNEITAFPRDLRRELDRRCTVGLPTVLARHASDDGARRYLLGLEDGKSVEAVFMPEAGRDTLCLSSQVGCPVNCRFCLTALMGLERNLTAGEIAGQVLSLASVHNLDPASRRMNIVMMGQGEPLLNLPNVLKATRILSDPEGMGVSERRITLSTSGLIPGILELGRERVRPKLAVSLNASTQEQRVQLMPIARKYPLKDLIEACRAYPLRPWERLTFEYVLLKGVNDSDADARRAAGLLGQLRAKVNLIALNPGPGIPFETPEAERVESFRRIVAKVLPCFVRKPRGLDIYAACGQLKRMEAVEILPASRP